MANNALNYYHKFLSWDVEKQNRELTHRSPKFWEKIGEEKALEVFHAAAKRVPAYKKFLESHGVNPRNIKTLEDFKQVPPVDKKNYIKAYPLHELCWDGDMTRMNVISVSSGSTGQPFFWPRDIWQEMEVDHFYELTIKNIFHVNERHSLVIIAFAIGMYIAGPFTFASLLRQAQKGYPLSVATPSNDIEAVLRVVKNLGPEFDQIIIGGYPPLVKDIIDRGKESGIAWGDHNTKLFFGGEGFTEKWRDYLHERVGAKCDLNTTINMYGTADAALLGIETPLSIAFRRLTASSKKSRKEAYNNERLPSVLSYNPLLKYFEALDDGSLLFTSSSGIPLIRYRIGDVGGVISYDGIGKFIKDKEKKIEELLKNGKEALSHWKLPIVYLFGRDDFTVQLYGANVYPENIKEALEDQRIANIVSGKFILATKYRSNMAPYLDLCIELSSGVKPDTSIAALVKQVVVDVLRSRNSEYEVIYNTIKKKAEPKISLELYGSKRFKINIKHRWVEKV